jgi:hypothetical protein
VELVVLVKQVELAELGRLEKQVLLVELVELGRLEKQVLLVELVELVEQVELAQAELVV